MRFASFGTGDYRETGARVAASYSVIPALSMGAFAEGLVVGITGYDPGLSGVVGVGSVADVLPRVRFSVLIQSVGWPSAGELALPASRSATCAVRYAPDDRLALMAGAEWEQGGMWRTDLGARVKLARWLSVSFGRSTGPAEFGAGCEMRLGSVACAYAVRFHDVLPPTQCITLTISR